MRPVRQLRLVVAGESLWDSRPPGMWLSGLSSIESGGELPLWESLRTILLHTASHQTTSNLDPTLSLGGLDPPGTGALEAHLQPKRSRHPRAASACRKSSIVPRGSLHNLHFWIHFVQCFVQCSTEGIMEAPHFIQSSAQFSITRQQPQSRRTV